MAFISPIHGGLVFNDDEDVKAQPKNESINKEFNPKKSDLTFEERFQLCKSIGEEVTTEDELAMLLKTKPQFICYDGFEPSGRMHIAQGILKSINVNKITKSGGIFLFWVADWFAMLNNKLGGDLSKIQIYGKYFIEIWKACGMDLANVKFLWASEEITKSASTYWLRVMDIARKNSISRIKKCCQIMGRAEGEKLQASQIFYPCMQCADIFYLNADICQLGMDQRKVNMLAIEYCDDIGRKEKPVIISHHMLMGLKEGQPKMSKSDPDSAIFMEDTEENIVNKVKKSYCPEGIVANNPIMDYCKHMIFPSFKEVLVKRTEKNGGDILFKSYEELEKAFSSKLLHPGDLKPAFAKYLNLLIEPVRKHFKENEYARNLLEEVIKIRNEFESLKKEEDKSLKQKVPNPQEAEVAIKEVEINAEIKKEEKNEVKQ